MVDDITEKFGSLALTEQNQKGKAKAESSDSEEFVVLSKGMLWLDNNYHSHRNHCFLKRETPFILWMFKTYIEILKVYVGIKQMSPGLVVKNVTDTKLQ